MKRVIVTVGIAVMGIAAALCLIFLPDWQEEVVPVMNEDSAVIVDDDPMAIRFSQTETFYNSSIDVAITCADGEAKLYYTTDGTTPSAEKGKEYVGAISISAGSRVKATTIKVIAVSGEETTDVITKSYIVGKDVFERFDSSTYVFVLSTDPYNLYDYYYGVAVPGYVRDQYLDSDEYHGGELEYNAPANWYINGRESERDMYVEVYDSTGTQLINQQAGGRVVGGYSRANDQKSWRLIARNEYSEGNGKFKFSFFNGAVDAYGQLLTRFDRITLRNNANDREFASIRDEVANELSTLAGFPDTQQTAPAAVFLNSEYYGFAWLHEAYSNAYLEENYGGIKDNYRIVGGKETDVEGDDEECVEDYYEMLELARSGLLDDESFEKFCELADIDNLMLYYAIEVYISNKDWPGNNFKAWRYYPGENEELQSEYQDGKWRFMLFDLEYAMGLYGEGANQMTLTEVLTGKHMQGGSDILNAVLEREDMREKFANTISDLIGGAFSTENALACIDEKIALCNTECNYALDNGYTSAWANRDTFADSRQQIKDFFKRRPAIMAKDIERNFEIEDNSQYKITVVNTAGGKAWLNTQSISGAGSVSGSYYAVYTVPLKAEPYDGYEFDHWDINGTTVTVAETVLDADMTLDNGIIATAYYRKSESAAGIYISRMYTAGDGDWFELYNPGSVSVTLSGYYLSDKDDQLDRWQLPTVTVPAESAVTIVCKNNKDSTALMKLVTNFNLKEGETLYLSDAQGNILSKASVVRMDKDKILVRGPDGVYAIEAYTE